MVPEGTAHVGCVTLAVVGVAGAPAAALIVTVLDAGVEQELSDILRTINMYVPGTKPLNVVLA